MKIPGCHMMELRAAIEETIKNSSIVEVMCKRPFNSFSSAIACEDIEDKFAYIDRQQKLIAIGYDYFLTGDDIRFVCAGVKNNEIKHFDNVSACIFYEENDYLEPR